MGLCTEKQNENEYCNDIQNYNNDLLLTNDVNVFSDELLSEMIIDESICVTNVDTNNVECFCNENIIIPYNPDNIIYHEYIQYIDSPSNEYIYRGININVHEYSYSDIKTPVQITKNSCYNYRFISILDKLMLNPPKLNNGHRIQNQINNDNIIPNNHNYAFVNENDFFYDTYCQDNLQDNLEIQNKLIKEYIFKNDTNIESYYQNKNNELKQNNKNLNAINETKQSCLDTIYRNEIKLIKGFCFNYIKKNNDIISLLIYEYYFNSIKTIWNACNEIFTLYQNSNDNNNENDRYDDILLARVYNTF